MNDNGLLYDQLKTAVEKIGERVEQKGSFPKLAVTDISEIGKNSEEVIEDIIERDISKGAFNTILLVKEEELLKMREKKLLVFRSHIVPRALLKVIIDSQKVICTIYNPTVPEGVVKEGLRNFVRSHKEIEEFAINHKYG